MLPVAIHVFPGRQMSRGVKSKEV